MPKIELTDEERRNGWTEESLRAYVAERERAQAGVVMFDPEHRKPQRPKWANNRYDPLKFGR